MKFLPRILLLLSFSLSFHPAIAQSQKYTMEQVVLGLRGELAVENIQNASWMDEGSTLVQSKDNRYIATEYPSGKTFPLISLETLNKGSETQFKRLPRIHFKNEKEGTFRSGQYFYRISKDNHAWKLTEWMEIPAEAENVFPVAEKGFVVYTIANNLYRKDENGVTQITHDQDPNILNGHIVHRQEFGIDKGIFIAPDQNKIAFYRMDQTMVTDYPIIDWSVTPAKNHNIKYPMAGQTSHQVSVGIFNPKTEKTTFLDIQGPKDQYLIAVTWSPDSQSIFVGVMNRAQNHLKMNQYDANSGTFIKTIFEESDEKYIDPQTPLYFIPGENNQFLWVSRKSGHRHFYLYNVATGAEKQITQGAWEVTSLLGFNEKKNEVFYVSTQGSPLERHLYKADLRSGKTTRLDEGAGVHHGLLNAEGTYLLDNFSNANTPRQVNVIRTKNRKTTSILTAKNPLTSFAQAQVKNITLKADDGTPLYGKLMLPADFNPKKKYPVIVYLYNGPHVQLITNRFPASGNLWYDLMTQKGYIVFSMDGRGSYNRGKKFEQATFHHLGTIEMQDQLKGVEYLKSLPYVDAERLGIHGWSFGGFMTISMMLRHPGVFKAAVAGGPVTDWKMYEVMYTERYMSTPQKNPEGYEEANLLDKVQNLEGKLLVIHGTQDDVVVWQHSIDLLKSAVDHGVQLDYFVYPGHPHNVRGKDRVHLMQKITDYFDTFLK